MAALPAMAEDGVVADITRDMIEWARLSVLTARLSRQSRKGSDFSDVLNTTTATSITKMSLCSSNRTDRTTPRTSKNWLSSRPLLNCSNDTGLAVGKSPGTGGTTASPDSLPSSARPSGKTGNSAACWQSMEPDFNTVEKIRADERFQKFLRWLYKQKSQTIFKSRRNPVRTDQKYR